MSMTRAKPFFRPQLAFSRGARTPSASPPGVVGGDGVRRFRETILPHLDGAYNLARYLTRDATAAEDIVQDAFLRAFRAFPAFRGEAPKAWLFAIVRNCFLNWAASGKAAAAIVVTEGALSDRESLALSNLADPDQDTPETALLRRRQAEMVRAVVETLPEPFREALVLREMEEMSYKEIAGLTGIPVGTVMSRLARARQMLAETLLASGGQDEGVGRSEAKWETRR
jgi:RNA polymerase sigma factor (sigma-70 family)